MFLTVADAISWIENIKRKDKRKDLTRIKYLLKKFNNPQNNYKIIHIAGTNGKGSVATYLKKIIEEKNYKVGCFVSPYVIKFNERIMVGDEYISDSELLEIVNEILPIIKEYETEYSDIVPFFEVVTLIGFIHFYRKKVTYAIIECGLGGRLDATNFVNPIATIITNVGLDHQNSLGETLEEIAYHKAGIIKNGVPCFCISDTKINEVIIKEAKIKAAPLFLLDASKFNASINNGTDFQYLGEDYHTPLYGLYQANNAALSIAVSKMLFPDIKKEEINSALSKVFWPGRFEFISNNIIIDGAHNIHGINALVETLKLLPYKKVCCCFTALKDKNYSLMLNKLDEIVDNYHFVSFSDSRGLSSEEFINLTTKKFACFETIDDAIAVWDGDLLLITGSLHFISEVRRILKK